MQTLNDRLEWTKNTEALYKEGPESTLHPAKTIILQCLQQNAADVLEGGVLGCSLKSGNTNRLNKLIKYKASCVIGGGIELEVMVD